MSDEKRTARSDEDARLEREIRAERKFSLEDAFGRLAGDGLLKGDSPVPKKRQAEFEIEKYLEQNLIDSERALQLVLLRWVTNSDLFLEQGYERPIVALEMVVKRLLASEPLLRDFVTEVDREWGRMYLERPRLQREDSAPDPDDPYTFQSVRKTLSRLLDQIRQ